MKSLLVLLWLFPGIALTFPVGESEADVQVVESPTMTIQNNNGSMADSLDDGTSSALVIPAPTSSITADDIQLIQLLQDLNFDRRSVQPEPTSISSSQDPSTFAIEK